MKKPILLVDFDGVLNSYKSGWQGARNIPDPPVKGAMSFLDHATRFFQVCIYSARSGQLGGKRAMKRWLRIHFEEYVLNQCPEFIELDPFNEDMTMANRVVNDIMGMIKFPTKKPNAFLTIDDRCICFDGTFGEPEQLLYFKPWNKV